MLAILCLIFVSILFAPIANVCWAQEDPSLFAQNQDIKQEIYSNNKETENKIDDTNLTISSEEVKKTRAIAKKVITLLIDKLAAKGVEKENVEKKNLALTQKMLSLISEKQAVKESFTKQNQALTQRIPSLINILSEREAEKESLIKQNQALVQEMEYLVNRISEKEVGKENPDLKKKVAAFLMDLSKREMEEKDVLRNEIDNLKKTLDEERAALNEKLGIAYIHAKMYNEAICAYEEVLTFNPNRTMPVYYLGLLYKYAEKNPKKAVQYLHRYVELAPKGEYAKKARELIKILE